MNTTLLIQQLTVAILASAITIPAIQRVKGWMPTDKMVELISVLLSFAIGFGVAMYYANYTLIDGLIVGLFSIIGAESIYKLLGDKLKKFTEIKYEDVGYVEVSPLSFETEIEHLMGESDE